jgi:hypothetical protein
MQHSYNINSGVRNMMILVIRIGLSFSKMFQVKLVPMPISTTVKELGFGLVG